MDTPKTPIKIQAHLLKNLNLFNTQREMAIQYGTSPAMISMYLSGKVKHPDLSFARKLYKMDGVVIYPYCYEAVSSDED